MKVGIIGAGAIAHGVAAHLAQAGHRSVLWSPSGASTRALAAGRRLVARGAIEGRFDVAAAADCAALVGAADVVVFALPANAHRTVMDEAARHLRPGQPVVISSHASFGALYLARALAARGVALPIAVWGTTVVTARMGGPGEVDVATVREKVDVATLPHAAAADGYALCTALFGDRFVSRDGLMAIALSNLNPQNHLGIALLNLTRMEKGERWSQAGHVTPAVGRVIEALDAERLAIAAAFGVEVRTVFQHFSLSFHVPMGPVAEMNAAMEAAGRGGVGPATLDSRYVLEDVPFGLWPTVVVGRIAGVPTPIHESGIAILCAAYGRNLCADNDLLQPLGIAAMSADTLRALATGGEPG